MNWVEVYGGKNKRARVPRYLVNNWLRERERLASRKHGFQRERNAKLYLDVAAGFRVMAVREGVSNHKQIVQLGLFNQQKQLI